MKALDVMTRDPVCVQPDDSIMKAVRLMLQRRISGLPVTGADGKLVGMVTESDLLRRAEIGTRRQRPRWLEFLIGPGLAAEYVQACGRKVHEVMSAPVRTASEQTPLVDVVQLMQTEGIKRVPILRDGRIVGIVSRADLLRGLALAASELRPVQREDAVIQKRIEEELTEQPWAPVALISVVVRDGVVHLWGSLTDERQRQALRVLAENTPGVKGVHDHLTWVEPTSGMVILAPEETASRKAS